MLLMAVLCNIAPAALIRLFSDDPAVITVGDEYLRIVSWTFPLSGLIFVCSSMFQAMGNTMPSLVASVTRVVVIAVPAILLSATPGFRIPRKIDAFDQMIRRFRVDPAPLRAPRSATGRRARAVAR